MLTVSSVADMWKWQHQDRKTGQWGEWLFFFDPHPASSCDGYVASIGASQGPIGWNSNCKQNIHSELLPLEWLLLDDSSSIFHKTIVSENSRDCTEQAPQHLVQMETYFLDINDKISFIDPQHRTFDPTHRL